MLDNNVEDDITAKGFCYVVLNPQTISLCSNHRDLDPSCHVCTSPVKTVADTSGLSRQWCKACEGSGFHPWAGDYDGNRYFCEVCFGEGRVAAKLGIVKEKPYREPGCICPIFKDTEGYRIADLCCSIPHGDGPWPTVQTLIGTVSVRNLWDAGSALFVSSYLHNPQLHAQIYRANRCEHPNMYDVVIEVADWIRLDNPLTELDGVSINLKPGILGEDDYDPYFEQ